MEPEAVLLSAQELPEYLLVRAHRRLREDHAVNPELRYGAADAYEESLVRAITHLPEIQRACAVIAVTGREFRDETPYGIRITRDIEKTGIDKVIFLRVKPLLLPAVLDFVSIAVALATVPSSAVLPTADAIYNTVAALVTLDKDRGDGPVIDTYCAFVRAKTVKATAGLADTRPTTEEIVSQLTETTPAQGQLALVNLQALGVIRLADQRLSIIDADPRWEADW